MLTTTKIYRCKVQGTNGKVKPDTVFNYNIAKKVLIYQINYRCITVVYEKPLNGTEK